MTLQQSKKMSLKTQKVQMVAEITEHLVEVVGLADQAREVTKTTSGGAPGIRVLLYNSRLG